MVLFNNVQISNAAYEKKDLEQQAALSTMTRVLDRVENHEGYVREVSEVAIIGDVRQQQEPLRVGPILGITGLYNISPITYPDTMEDYFKIVLQSPIQLCSWERQKEIMGTEAFAKMGIFPAENSIATIDGVIVVKLS